MAVKGTKSERLTIGVLAGWPVYTGRFNKFLAEVFQGITAAARQNDCNVLLACGLSPAPHINYFRIAWPTLAVDQDFVPVGPWNTDGLLVILPLLSESRTLYIQELIQSGYPIICMGSEGKLVVPSVLLDNTTGIHQGIKHLIAHAHNRIAYIAGVAGDPGDSAERLNAYRTGLALYGIPFDPALVAWGNHNRKGGQQAMGEILNRGGDFTAVMASNDESLAGALEVLRSVGRKIPEDIAVVGFDDALEARSVIPPLTTIRSPMHDMGEQALKLLCRRITGDVSMDEKVYVSTRLVIRRSCGCQPATMIIERQDHNNGPLKRVHLVKMMTEAVSAQTYHMTGETLHDLCEKVLEAICTSLECGDQLIFHRAFLEALHYTEIKGDDLHAWQAAISVLALQLPHLLSDGPEKISAQSHETLLHQARILISESIRRQYSQSLIDQDTHTDEIALLTARLLMVFDEAQIITILEEGLASFGIKNAHVILFEAENDDPVALSVIRPGSDTERQPRRFASRNFPPPGLYDNEQAFQLAFVPVVSQGLEAITGYIAFAAEDLMVYTGLFVQHLNVALRGARLYHEAMMGRQLAEEANRLKSRFLSMVSHELSTPLSLIVGLSEMLLRPQDQIHLMPPSYKQDVEQINASAQYLSGLIRDVLDLASSEVGQFRLTLEPLNLSEVLEMVIQTAERQVRAKGLRWEVEITERLPKIRGDRTRLRQVLLNLINNAVKFTTEGYIKLRIITGENTVEISLQDSGPGIPPTDQEAIFDEFWQSDRTRKQGFGGMGLGLAICKRIVELHGGSINVRSAGNLLAGTTFTISLPAMSELVALSHLEQPAPESLLSVILLVSTIEEGNPVYTYLIERGYKVHEYELINNEGDWLPMLAQYHPVAIILDQQVASNWGWDIRQRIKNYPITTDIPVLVYALNQSSGSLIELEYMAKPVDPAELNKALLRHGFATGNLKKTILIVDDDANIRNMHMRMTQTYDPTHRVLQARNGRDAMDIIREEKIDLVLLDLMMPEMDGFAVLEELRTSESTRNIPVIILSARFLSEADMERLNTSVVAVLGKGVFTLEEMLGHIEASLTKPHKMGSEAQRVVRKVMAHIHTHYDEMITREELARYASVSKSYLNYCFDQELGVAPMIYLNRYRVNQAKTMLSISHQSITDIAIAVGFGSVAYFSRMFQREIGVSPRAYRQGKLPTTVEASPPTSEGCVARKDMSGATRRQT